MADNLSLVLYKKLDIRLEQRPIPEPGPGGDRVALEPGVPCRTCRHCIGGRYNLCQRMKYCATPPHHGTLTRYFVHPEDFCFKLPDHVSFEEGAMLQPLSIAVHACERGNVSLGEKVLICGAGPVGILCLLTARVQGADKIIITDVDKDRLDYAKNMGADYTALAGDPRETADCIRLKLGDEPNVTLECSGAPSSICTSMLATASGGRIVQVGYGPEKMQLPFMAATSREVDILGMSTILNNYLTALSMVATGQVNVKQLITHRFKLEQSMEALQAAFKREGVKIIINCQKD